VQFPESAEPPEACLICGDERQYVGWEGQRWTTMEELREGHTNRIEALEPGITGIGTIPAFAIGQRALLVQTPQGNLLWDCVSLFDDDTVRAVRDLGGIDPSRSPILTTTRRWSTGAASSRPLSTCTRPTGAG